MDLFTNAWFTPKQVVRVFGTRTLVMANNTNQEGIHFTNIDVKVRRKGFTSSVSIVSYKHETMDKKLGLYFGTNLTAVHGVKFQGKTWRGGKHLEFILCTIDGEIKEGGITWIMSKDGWIADGHWEIRVECKDVDGNFTSKALHPTGGEPYEFPTKEEAEKSIDMCYPMNHSGVRVAFVARK